MNYKDILAITSIKKVQVKDKVLIVNGILKFEYSHCKIAKAVANKLKNFVNIE